MYQPRTPGYRKSNAEIRWALPDRVFFACGACHILADAFWARWGRPGMRAIWIRRGPWGVIQREPVTPRPALVVASLGELVERVHEVW